MSLFQKNFPTFLTFATWSGMSCWILSQLMCYNKPQLTIIYPHDINMQQHIYTHESYHKWIIRCEDMCGCILLCGYIAHTHTEDWCEEWFKVNTRGGNDDEGREIIGYVYMKILILLWTVCNIAPRDIHDKFKMNNRGSSTLNWNLKFTHGNFDKKFKNFT